MPTNSATRALRGLANTRAGCPVCKVCPASTITTRSAKRRASAKSWVTKTMGTDTCWRKAASSRYRVWRVGASTAEKGSSNNSTPGQASGVSVCDASCMAGWGMTRTNALAKATRCCCPPESCDGLRWRKSCKPKRSSKALTSCGIQFGPAASATLSCALMCGNKA